MYNTILDKLHLGFLKFDAANGSHDSQLVEKGKRLLAQSRRHHRNKRKRDGLHSAAEAAQVGISSSGVNSGGSKGGGRGGGSRGGGWLRWGGSGRGTAESAAAAEEESVVVNGAYDYDDYGDFDQEEGTGGGGGGGGGGGEGEGGGGEDEVDIDSLLSPLLNGNIDGLGDEYGDSGSGKAVGLGEMLGADAQLIDGPNR